jgi:hypothetical protein
MRGLWKLGALVAVVAATLGLGSSALGVTGWSGPTVIDTSAPPTAISCPSVSFCAAVGTGGFVETFDGRAWSTPIQPDPNGNSLTAVSCASASFCVAVDNLGQAITFNGSAWSAPAAVDTTRNALHAVSCASSSFCVAGDVGGNGFVWDGAAWAGPITINHVSNSEAVGGISCPSASFCVAAGQAGSIEISTNGGTAWSTPTTVGPNNLQAVSCPSSAFCVTVDTAGNAYTFNGTAWSAANPIDTVNGQISGGALDSVSCSSSAFCAAIDGRENVLTFDGSTWTAPASLESGTVSRPGVSCPAPSTCVAVDGAGNGFTYGTAAPPSPTTLPAPVLGKSADVSVVSGVVMVRTGHGKFVRLTAARQIPMGSEINALRGSLKLVTATARQHVTQTGTFRGGVFRMAQASRGASKGLATLSLLEGVVKGAPAYSVCTRKGKSADASAAAASHKVLQLLHASAHGKFRTAGRYSAATVRGTVWSVANRCDGTLTQVVTGTVAVTDFVRRITVVLHAGHSYLARSTAQR